MDESVITGNITRVVENLCHDELRDAQSRRRLSARPTRPARPTAIRSRPRPIVDAFSEALKALKTDATDQVPDPEGAQPGAAWRDQRDLRRPQPAPDATSSDAGAGASERS